MPQSVLIVARDPGGANTVAPLVQPLQQQGYVVSVFGKDMALDKFRQAGLDPVDLTAVLSAITPDTLRAFLGERQPAVLITGTSAEDFTEKWLWQATEQLGIPSLAILDQWVNYGIRFSPYGVSQMAAYQQTPSFPYRPTRILVMDALAQAEMAAEVDADLARRIEVSGHPYFDALYAYQQQCSETQRQQLRKQLYQAQADDVVIGFASEPITLAYPNHDWGYTERSILAILLAQLDALAAEFSGTHPNRNIVVALRPHPRENRADYEARVAQWQHPVIRLVVENTVPSWDFIAACDLITGMSSMLLLEAALLQKPMLSIQIGLQRPDPFLLSRQQQVPTMLDPRTLQDMLHAFLIRNQSDAIPAPTHFAVIPNAVHNVITIMEQLVCQPSQPASSP